MRHLTPLVALFLFLYFSLSLPLAGAAPDEGFLGLILKQLTPTTVSVEGLASGASAQKAGVKAGDVLVSIEGKKIVQLHEFVKATKATAPGKTVQLKISRAGKSMTFKILVVSRETFLGAGIDALKGKPVPELVANNVATGAKFELSKLQGMPVVLELWATWCPACVGNIPDLEAVAKKYSGKVKIVALSFESTAKVKAFFKDHAPAYDLVATESNDQNLSYMNNSTIPKFIVVDAKGIVVQVLQRAADLDPILEQMK